MSYWLFCIISQKIVLLHSENLEKYPSLVDIVTDEPLEKKNGATLFVFQAGSDHSFYLEVTMQQVDVPAANTALALKFGDSSGARVLDLMKQRVDVLGSIPVRPASARAGRGVLV